MAVLTRNILSLCAGYGGLDLGLRLVDPAARTVCYVEREATAAGILAARFADGSLEPAPVWSDLKTFDGKPWRGTVDIVTAGYPCQPFSVAGKRLGAKDPRHLWPDVARIVREVEPEWCFFENVGGHLRLGFREVAGELRRMGYRVAAGLFTAEEVGAPHRRERLFILAHFDGGRRAELGAALDQNGRNARRNDARRRNETLEDAARLTGERGRRRGRVSQASDALADAGDGLVSQSRRRSQERTGARSAVADLAHAELGRLANGLDKSGDSRRGRRPASIEPQSTLSCGALFPPGPADLDAWRAVLARTPEIEPAIRRGFDGITPRVDRLRALGNGVVPLVAAHAYRTLRAALEDGYGQCLTAAAFGVAA